MITSDKTEQLVSMQPQRDISYKPRKSYIDLTALFQRIPSEMSVQPMKAEPIDEEGIDLDDVQSEYAAYSADDEMEQIELEQVCKSDTDICELMRRSATISFTEEATFNKLYMSTSPPPLLESSPPCLQQTMLD